MKGCICYYSTTGNTLLACKYIARKLPQITFTFHSITRPDIPDFDSYDIVGFATFTDFLAPSKLFTQFLKKIPHQNQKPAFVFNSYGNFNGGTLMHFCNDVTKKGFAVIAAHALHMPENHPVMICMGVVNADAPDTRKMDDFNRFINELSDTLSGDLAGIQARRFSFIQKLWPRTPRFLATMQMGRKFVDASECIHCGLCRKNCGYTAIVIKNDIPVFNEKKCGGCWSCYNHCPTQAIYTKKYRKRGHYPKPLPVLEEKLGTPSAAS